jgi:hypothetical protein
MSRSCDQDITLADRIKAITGAVIDPELDQTVKQFHIAHQAALDTHDPVCNPALRASIPKSAPPLAEFSSLTNFDHDLGLADRANLST